MSIQPAILTPTATLTTSVAAIYTAPTSGQVVVKRAVFTNIGLTPQTVTVYRVPSGGTAANSNKIISEQRINPGETYIAAELSNMVLNGGDSIQANASALTAINATMSGLLV